MEESARQKIFNDIVKHFFVKFDTFMIKKWYKDSIEGEITEAIRQKAYKRFYNKIKKSNVASKKTVEKWFGIGGESMPNRKQIINLAFALNLDADGLNDYLVNGISEPEIQVNDFEEYIAMYCLDNGIGKEVYLNMINIFEKHYQLNMELSKTAHTNELKNQYEKLKKCSGEDFLLWICENIELFKGYSITTYNYFDNLMDKVYSYIQNDMRDRMFFEISETPFFAWCKQNKITPEHYAKAIPTFIKNELRKKGTSETYADILKEIRYYYIFVYSSRRYTREVITELYLDNYSDEGYLEELLSEYDDESRNVIMKIKNELKKTDAAYVSNLLNIATQKEEELQISKALHELSELKSGAECPKWIRELISSKSDEKKKKDAKNEYSIEEANEKLKYLMKRKSQRVKQIQRKDLLIPIQYITQKEYMIKHRERYNMEEARREFMDYANAILGVCGMRLINPEYQLDYLLLECFAKDEMCLFAEVFE